MTALLTMPEERMRSSRPIGIDLRPRMIEPLAELLRQLATVIEALTDAHYVQKPVGVIESSIGGHVRHCLDHVQSLLVGIDTGWLDYDHRHRGTAVENSRACAFKLINSMIDQLASLPAEIVTGPLSVSTSMSCDDAAVIVLSSVGRELAFVLSHTIHHNAIVTAMVKTLGGQVPNRFGYAPSTVKHLEKKQCAQ